jgi:hypothetical protein
VQEEEEEEEKEKEEEQNFVPQILLSPLRVVRRSCPRLRST